MMTCVKSDGASCKACVSLIMCANEPKRIHWKICTHSDIVQGEIHLSGTWTLLWRAASILATKNGLLFIFLYICFHCKYMIKFMMLGPSTFASVSGSTHTDTGYCVEFLSDPVNSDWIFWPESTDKLEYFWDFDFSRWQRVEIWRRGMSYLQYYLCFRFLQYFFLHIAGQNWSKQRVKPLGRREFEEIDDWVNSLGKTTEFFFFFI